MNLDTFLHALISYFVIIDPLGMALVFNALTSGHTVEEAFESLLEQYNVDPDTLKSDMDQLIEKLMEKGLIQVDAFHEAGQINIRIRDDGRGIDPEVIKRKAIDKGLDFLKKSGFEMEEMPKEYIDRSLGSYFLDK